MSSNSFGLESLSGISYAFSPYQTFSAFETVYVYGGQIQAYSQPSVQSSVAFTLDEGTDVKILKRVGENKDSIQDFSNDWYEILTGDFRQGYVPGVHLTPLAFAFMDPEDGKQNMILFHLQGIRLLQNGNLLFQKEIQYESGKPGSPDVPYSLELKFFQDFFGKGMPAFVMMTSVEACGYPIKTQVMGILQKQIQIFIEKTGLIDPPVSHTFSYYFLPMENSSRNNVIVEVETQAEQPDNGSVEITNQMIGYYTWDGTSLKKLSENIR